MMEHWNMILVNNDINSDGVLVLCRYMYQICNNVLTTNQHSSGSCHEPNYH